ncbi:hypothetical protein PAXINDRAFT_169138, partial [Paxillus involutus ATCC 200175]
MGRIRLWEQSLTPNLTRTYLWCKLLMINIWRKAQIQAQPLNHPVATSAQSSLASGRIPTAPFVANSFLVALCQNISKKLMVLWARTEMWPCLAYGSTASKEPSAAATLSVMFVKPTSDTRGLVLIIITEMRR